MEGILVSDFRVRSRTLQTVRSWPVLLAALLLAMLAFQTLVLASAASAAGPDDPGYWEDLYPGVIDCFKHTGDSVHGNVTNDGEAVTLKPFNQNWPGNHYALLVVNSGDVDHGAGPGNALYPEPAVGSAYFGPKSESGEQGQVEHWIICKGEAEVTTTTTTEAPTTTTTTQAPVTTTTTEAPATTTTTEASTTTTAPVAPTSTAAPTTTAAPTSTTAGSNVESSGVETLPDTGAEVEDVAVAGALLLLFGLVLVGGARVAGRISTQKD
jgi:hypothetical protein